MASVSQVRTNRELVKELQNRIITNSLSKSEIDNLTFTLVKKTGKCFFCGRIEEVSKLAEITLDEKGVKRLLAIKWLKELGGETNSTLKQKFITNCRENAKNEKLQKNLREIGKFSLEDFFAKPTKLEKK